MQDDLGLAKDLLALSNELGGTFEKPRLLRITLYARPGPGEFDVLVDPPGPERVVVDLRAGHREPSTPQKHAFGPRP